MRSVELCHDGVLRFNNICDAIFWNFSSAKSFEAFLPSSGKFAGRG